VAAAGSRLDDAALFEPTVPASWGRVVEALAEFEALVRDERPLSELRLDAARLRRAIHADPAVLCGEIPARLRRDSADYRRWFSEAALLWTRFAAAGGTIVIDSLGSATLPHFAADFPDDERAREVVREALVETFGWRRDELLAIERSLLGRISNLDVRRAIVERLRVLAGDSPDGIAALVRRIYGLPLRAGDVDLVMTTTTVMVLLPYRGTVFERPDFGERPAEERAAITRFLERVGTLKNTFETVRFPAFGLLDFDAVDPTLLADLAGVARSRPGLERVTDRVVADTLYTMVSLIPRHEAEMQLIHDVWGHGWEETLCDFEWMYARLVALRERVPAALVAPALQIVAGRVTLDQRALDAAVSTDLRDRITVGLNVVLAEWLADLVEHKYVRTRPPDAPLLPSSSLLPDAPSKLDLNLRDTQMMLRAAHAPYRRLLANAQEPVRLADELRASGLPEAGLAQAVAEAIDFVRVHYGRALNSGFGQTRVSGADAEVSLATRVMLAMVANDVALERFLEEGEASRDAGPAWWSARSSIDLLVLLLGWFYEQDRALHFWHLDELLRSELGPTLQRFEAEVRARVR
jgi:hypothetical protein